jgi:glycogen(starch) synthase
MICTIHATEYGRNQGIHNELQEYISNIESWMGNEAQKAIVNSQYMKDEVKRVFGLSENKIRVIYNGVSLNKFKDVERDNEFRAKFAFDNEKIIFFVGRLVREKGVHILIEAMPKVVNYYNDVKLIIAGKGPETDNLKRMAWDMGLGKKIHFTGYLSDEDLTKLYKCADISVFPSLYEPFGIVVLESMLANVPVVVSEAGGLSEIIEHNVDGMKSYTGNANSLSDSILDLLHNPDKVDTLTKNARKKLKMKYNWRKITKETKKAYKEVIADAKNIKWEKPVDINNI